MRPRFAVFILVIVAAMVTLVLWRRPIQHGTIPLSPQISDQSTNPPVGNVRVASQNVPNAPPAVTPPANQKSSGAINPRSPEGFKQYIQSQNAPIEFYGKVIDQDSNPVPGAKISIGIRHWTMPDPVVLLAGSKTINLEQISDVNGRFEFHGATGDGFGVGITKDGYELEQNKYGSGPTAGSSDEPVIFKMWSTNIHEKLITGGKSFDIVPDGRPYFVNLTDDTISESGEGDLKVWIQYTNQIVPGQLYDWSARIEVINGGLLEKPLGTAMFEAPPDGYVPAFQLSGQIKGGQRGDTGERQFYLKLKNDQEYGQMSIGLYAPFNDQTPGLIRLSYAINPSGSRILR